jgi:hypothetical protein
MKPRIFALFLAMTTGSCSSFAEPVQSDKPARFVRVGTTVYVSGHFTKWAAQFLKHPMVPTETETVTEPKTETVVLVDLQSERQERLELGWNFKKRGEIREWNIVVVGRCDLFCARFALSGKTRTLAPGAYFDLQVPRDYATKQLEPKFPNTQFAIYESNPAAMRHKDVFYEAFTQGGETGGLQVNATSAQFCISRNPDTGCKDYPLNAVALGLITSGEPARISIPSNLIR